MTALEAAWRGYVNHYPLRKMPDEPPPEGLFDDLLRYAQTLAELAVYADWNQYIYEDRRRAQQIRDAIAAANAALEARGVA